MKEHGKVIKMEGNKAVVEIKPEEACTKCCSCNTSKKRYLTVTKDETAAFALGDTVEVGIDSSSMMKVYTMLYAVPLIVFTTFILGMYKVTNNPVISFFGSAAATVLAYMVVGKWIKKRDNLSSSIYVKKM